MRPSSWRDKNHFHDILRLFDALPNFLSTTSKTIRDYYYTGTYGLPHKLRSEVRLKVLAN